MNIFYEDPLFTTLSQSGGQGEGSTLFDSIKDNVVVQSSQLEGEKRPLTEKSQQDVSFTVEEDNLLVSTLLDISINAIWGADKKYTQMWERISKYYNQHKKSNNPERSTVSLTNRWQYIQKYTNKFCAALAQVESFLPSGATEKDKIEKANYTMEHCWCLLKHQLKWQQHRSTLSRRRKPPGKHPVSANLAPDDILYDNVKVIRERPLGRKAEKERERKRKCREGADAEFNYTLARMTDDRNKCLVERREAVTKAELNRIEQLALEKK